MYAVMTILGLFLVGFSVLLSSLVTASMLLFPLTVGIIMLSVVIGKALVRVVTSRKF